MNYNEFSELCKSKNIRINDVCMRIDMSRPGLVKALDLETIELRKLKLLCDYIRITPAMFFPAGAFGTIQPSSATATSKKIEDLEKEIEYLRERLKDKEDIINLLREKSGIYSVAAERSIKYELKK